MLVSEVSTSVNWSDNIRNFVTRKIFKYEEGNNVTVVIIKDEKFNLYNEKGEEIKNDKGTNVDFRV